MTGIRETPRRRVAFSVLPTRGVLLALTLGAALTLTGCSRGDSSRPGPATSSSAVGPSVAPSSAPPLTAAQGEALSAALAAGTTEAMRAAVVVPTDQPLDASVAGQLGAAGPVALDLGTFRRLDAANATVNGRLTHPPAGLPAEWTFVLTWQDGTWKIVDTQPAAPTPSPSGSAG